jgi:imidazolonepropionase-like amidohydrolase
LVFAGLRNTGPHAHQVIGGGREGEDPADFENAPMAQLPEQRNGLQPTDAFLNALAFLLTDFITRMALRPGRFVFCATCGSRL